jgi:hypothetical protein
MSITSLPGLSLELHKTKSQSVNASSTLSNTINVNVDGGRYSKSPVKSARKPSSAPPNSVGPEASPKVLYDSDEELPLAPFPAESPKDRISTDFMKTLIRIQTELLLDNIALLNNLKEFGNKVIYRKKDLLEMIEILMGVSDIQINTEKPKELYGCSTCKVPLYVKIKSITLGKTIPFLPTEVATRLQEEFKISLEFCIPDILERDS